MLRAYIVVVLATFLLGCPVEPSDVDAGPDPDGGAEIDADPRDPALRFVFVSAPQLPDGFSGDHRGTIEESEFLLENLRAIGDAAPGDERTTQAELGLEFPLDELDNVLYFPDAPPGLYSHLLIQVVYYHISGTVVLDTDPIPFVIEDEISLPLAVSIELEGVEVVDELVEVEIEVDLDRVVTEVSWDELDPDSESVEIDEDSSLIDAIRERVEEAFEHEDSSSESHSD